MRSLLQDLRYALRHLRRSPGFTLTAVLTLAIGIGATTAVFSMVEGVLLRPLPFPGQSRLVALADIVEGVDYGDDSPGVTGPGTRVYMRDTTAFSSLGSYQPSTYELSGLGDPMQIGAARLSAGMFQVLAVPPLIGRVFTAARRRFNCASDCAQLSDVAKPLPRRRERCWKEDSSRPQTVRDHRGHAPGL